jgi:hypothetical protein
VAHEAQHVPGLESNRGQGVCSEGHR